MLKVILFLGYSGSGKTRSVVHLAEALINSGATVGTIKSVHEPNFAIDTKGKDSWLHANAGSSIVEIVAVRELVLIRKQNTKKLSLEYLLLPFKEAGVDYVLVEGLYRRVSRRSGILKIICASSEQEASILLKEHGPAICIIGRTACKFARELEGVPVFKLPRDTKKILALVKSKSALS